MGYTMIEKILVNHSDKKTIKPGEYILLNVDRTHAKLENLKKIENYGLNLWDAERVYIVNDHYNPAISIDGANEEREIRRLVTRYKIKNYFKQGLQGISHQLFPEKGFVAPGEFVVMDDSHTVTMGAYNAAACGTGKIEITYVLATGELWLTVPESVKINLVGQLAPYVYGKDIIIEIMKNEGLKVGLNRALEFVGLGASNLSLDSRLTISNMATEMGAMFALFEYDKKTEAFLDNRVTRIYNPVKADIDAKYGKTINYNISNIKPMVAIPSNPSNGFRVSDIQKENIKIDQAFLGSCANGRLEDFAIAAKILDGKSIHNDVRMIVSPASQEIWKKALRAGYLEKIADAGALITHSTCGACFGGHLGVVGDNEVCISTSNRNFVGRMGSPKALIYLANPATVAASALTGKIVDPQDYLGSNKLEDE